MDLFVYADESGTQRRDVICLVGGYIASPRQWGRLNNRWRATLESEHIEEFHARDFFHKETWESAKSPYHGWTAARGDTFLAALVEVIGGSRIYPVAGAVPHGDFDAQSKQMRQFVTGGQGLLRVTPDGATSTMKSGTPMRAYQAAWMFLVVDALKRASPDAMVHFVFDVQDEYAPYAVQEFARFKKAWPAKDARRLGGISYESSRDHPELQVADLYCYLQARALAGRTVTQAQYAALRVLNKPRPAGIMVLTPQVYETIAARIGAKVRAELARKATKAP